MVKIIAALTSNRVIGKNGSLPWRLPGELKRFRKLTTNNVVLMGRNTFDEVGILPHRFNVVVSKTLKPGLSIGDSYKYGRQSYEVYADVEEAINNCSEITSSDLYIIGGAQIYNSTLHLADVLELTIVHEEYEGDRFFPEYEHLIGSEFKLENEEPHDRFTYKTYIRI